MKKIIFLIAIILFGNNAISQKKTYLLFEFMKVVPEQESAYLETERFWEKIHGQRVINGEIEGWYLLRMEAGGENPDYQYVTVQVFQDLEKMLQNGGGESFLKIAKKAFPDMSDADLLYKRTESLKSRDLAETFYLEQIDRTKGKFEMSSGAVVGINFMKVSPANYADYENTESKIFKPEWQSRVDARAIGSWSLLKVINSKENTLSKEISYVSLDKFRNYSQLLFIPNNMNISHIDPAVWQEALAKREISTGRAVLIKKTGNGF
jgi:hypothetical protein